MISRAVAILRTLNKLFKQYVRLTKPPLNHAFFLFFPPQDTRYGYTPSRPIVMLIGNKEDCNEERQVDKERGIQVSKKYVGMEMRLAEHSLVCKGN